jgi:hypothetical protein
MSIAWDWQWFVCRNSINLTIDLCSLMIGFCVGPRDVVVHVGIVTLCIEHWPDEVTRE